MFPLCVNLSWLLSLINDIFARVDVTLAYYGIKIGQ